MDNQNDMYFEHPLIKSQSINRREYQVKIATKALTKPTLIVLPTGLGKTVVALITIAERLRYNGGPILMLAPTKPLVEQHRSFMDSHLMDREITMLTGEIPPDRRGEMYGRGDMIVSTPQVVKNDLISGDLDISGFKTLIFDEAHRSVGDYPYTFIAERFYDSNPEGLVMGLTASPGHDVSRIYSVCQNLGIENIEIRVDSDPDVKPYIQDLDVKWVKVEVSKGIKTVSSILERMYLERIKKLQRMGVVRGGRMTSVKELLGAAGRIQEYIKNRSEGGGAYYQAMSIQAQAMKISHALELAETQGADALYAYLDRLLKESGESKSSKATRKVVSDPLFTMAMNKTHSLLGEDHPKVEAVERFVKQKLREDPESRIIVFTHFRDTATAVHDRLSTLEPIGVKAVRFVGQARRGEDQGLNQKQQKGLLQDFRDGRFNVLIATSVAEEGLDIPGADLVIFYEPIPSEIRTIQRRGRTGRHSAGSVIVLMSKETRDVAYSWSAKDKEMRMERQLMALRRMIEKKPLNQVRRKSLPEQGERTPTLDSFDEIKTEEGGIEVVVDQREMPSTVVEELIRIGLKVRPEPISEGDYVISDRVLVERKTARDFADSLIDGRLFDQIGRMRERYERPILVIEGDDPFAGRNISREALYGAFASITADFNVPVMFTRDPADTAVFINSLASREKKKGKAPRSTRMRKGGDLRSIQVGILSSIPGISATLADRLIDHFSSVHGVFTAGTDDLSKVEGIGKVKAREIRNVITGETAKDQ
ncbi:MAG: DEAD/DEAH box helicase [Thermoplasmatota archaeon]